MKRRKFFGKMASYGLGLVSFTRINSNAYLPIYALDKEYSDRAIRLVRETTAIDTLNTIGNFLTPIQTESVKSEGEIWLSEPGSFTVKDYQHSKDSGIDIFAPGFLSPNYAATMEQMARWNGFIASNSRYLDRIDLSRKLDTILKSEKIGVLLSLQNSTHFRTVEDVNLFYELGQRVSQLTYNTANKLGCGVFEDEDTGLTEFGAEIVQRMNEVGMAVDVSHCGDKTTLDAVEASQEPVLVTHAPCRALNPGYARAKTDEAIIKVAATGGVIGIPMLRFLVREKEPVTIEHFIDHIDHVAKLVGIEHVGIGSDQNLDTTDALSTEWRKRRLKNASPKYMPHTNEKYQLSINGLNHSRRTFNVAEGLIRRNYSDEQIKLVLGENFKRVLKYIFRD